MQRDEVAREVERLLARRRMILGNLGRSCLVQVETAKESDGAEALCWLCLIHSALEEVFNGT